MKDIIQINTQVIGADTVNAVNARELWKALESKQQFADWIKKRLERFIENEDFIVIHNSMKNPQGGRPQKEYIITVDTAKMIAMMENNQKGDEIRRYFIEIEKKYKADNPSYMIEDPIKRAERWIEEEKERQKLALENKQMKPKAEYFDALVERKLLTNFRDTAKEFGIGQKDFIHFLLDNHFIFRDKNKQIKPYNEFVPELFEIKEWKSKKKSGLQTLITPKGRETFRLLLNK